MLQTRSICATSYGYHHFFNQWNSTQKDIKKTKYRNPWYLWRKSWLYMSYSFQCDPQFVVCFVQSFKYRFRQFHIRPSRSFPISGGSKSCHAIEVARLRTKFVCTTENVIGPIIVGHWIWLLSQFDYCHSALYLPVSIATMYVDGWHYGKLIIWVLAIL